MEDIGITGALYIRQSRFYCFFEDPASDVNKFFNETIVEFRLTFGNDFSNPVFSTKGQLLRRLTQTNFRRGSESSFERNVILFGNDHKSINLRITVGACRQFETDTNDINDLTLVREGNVFLAPPNFFNSNVVFNALPTSWLRVTERVQ